MEELTDPLENLRAWRGDYNSSAPQDWEAEVAPVEAEIQRNLDARLRIIWNPRSYLARPLIRDAEGRVSRPAEYAGRYQVAVPGSLDGELTALHTLGSELGPEKPYRAVGPWLVDFLRQWDTQNVYRAKEMARLIKEESDRLDDERKLANAVRRDAILRFATNTLKMNRERVAGSQMPGRH